MSTRFRSNSSSSPVSALDIFPASRIKLSASPLAVLLLLIYSPFGFALALIRLVFFGLYMVLAALQLDFYWIQRILMSLMGVFMKSDDKILGCMKSNYEGKKYIYVSTWNTYADRYFLPTVLKCKYYRMQLDKHAKRTLSNNKPAKEPLNDQALTLRPFQTRKFENAIYFAENTPSSAAAILSYPKRFSFAPNDITVENLSTNYIFIPIVCKVNYRPIPLPLEPSTIYSTPFWDFFLMIFTPFTFYQISGCNPSLLKLREGENIDYEFTTRIRLSQANATGMKLSNICQGDKVELLKRYLLDEIKAEVEPMTQGARRGGANNNNQQQPPVRVNSTKLTNDQICQNFGSIFPDLSKETILQAYNQTGGNHDLTLQALLKISQTKTNNENNNNNNKAEEKEASDKSSSCNNQANKERIWKNPIEKNMSLEERRVALYSYAKARYIHKYGSLE